jgi:hypothetical protein
MSDPPPSNADLAKMIQQLTTTVNSMQQRVDSSLLDMQQQIGELQQWRPPVSSSSGDSRGRGYGDYHGDRPPRFQKLDFPKFDGKSDPLAFINRCESYFVQQRIAAEEQVWMASYNLEDVAQMWYLLVQQSEGMPNWRRFTELLNLRFGPPLRSNPMGELMACRRTGSVADYQARFEALLPRAGRLDEAQRVQAFTAGLLPPLSHDVELHNPQTLVVAMSLARKLERREQDAAAAAKAAIPPPRLAGRGLLAGPVPQLALPAPTTAPGRPIPSLPTARGRQIRRLSLAEMDDRRQQGLCFNCNEKYSRGHNRVCQRLFFLDLAEEDAESSAAADEAEQPLISLHAIAGVRLGDTMQVHISLGGVSLLALLDSGSTHNFVAEEAAARTSLRLQPRGGMRVTVANGDRVPCPGVFRAAPFSVNGAEFTTDFFALPLAGYDVVLGAQWLATLGPILWDFSAHTMSFWHQGRRVCWKGVAGPASPGLKACIPIDLMPALLEEFGAIFAEPTGMPPPRSRDHRINLLPGSPPVAVRPYRYPNAHKDELERQCTSMMEQGLIRRSCSAFSSPVLLVKKADGSWRFCVDYRALNAITVKDAYPIPVVDELLDELHGARLFTKLDLRSGYHQVRMFSGDVEKTAFRTHEGL